MYLYLIKKMKFSRNQQKLFFFRQKRFQNINKVTRNQNAYEHQKFEHSNFILGINGSPDRYFETWFPNKLYICG